MQFTGPYLGTVAANADPAKLGRVKVSVPHVYDGIGTGDLPWAIPAGLPAGGSHSSGGIDWVPEPGDQVIVFFLDGEPEKPVWLWMMQTVDQATTFPLHHYPKLSTNPTPDRGALTRYGHTVELNAGSVIVSTRSGYQLYAFDGDPLAFDGNITLQTPRAQMFELDDLTETCTLNVNLDTFFNIGMTWQVMCSNLDFETVGGGFNFNIGGGWTSIVAGDIDTFSRGNITNYTLGHYSTSTTLNWNVIAENMVNITSFNSINIDGPALNLGTNATEPFVLGNRLVELLNSLLMWCSGHSHGNGNNGSPTGPPIVPPQVGGTIELLSTIIRGQ